MTLMGLRDDDWFGHSLIRSAALIGKNPRDLLDDPGTAIRAAAAYLRDLRSHETLPHLAALGATQAERLETWGPALAKYTGIPTPTDAKEAVAEIFKTLERGVNSGAISIPRVDGRFSEAWISRVSQMIQSTSDSAAPADYPLATWDPSPNFDLNANRPRQIIIHTTQGSFAGAVSWLKNPQAKVSAHYVIRSSDGAIKQLVREKDKAWHARCWNPVTIGIEHEGFIESNAYYTPALYKSSARLVAELARNYGIPVDGLNVVGHNFWSKPEFKQSELYREGLICNDHIDPGQFWDWKRFLSLIGAYLRGPALE
jgi:N-acetyl-anhydromuramyl-L-alanine amidase AmpD